MTYKTNEKCIRYKKRKNDFIDRKSISTALLGKIEYEIPTAAAEDTISDFKGFIHWCQQITLCLKLLNVIAGLFFLKGRYCIWLSSRRHHLIFQQKTTRRADGWRRVTRNSRNIFSLSLHAHFRLGSFRYAALIGIDVRISTVVVVLVALPPHSAKFTN